MDAYLDAANRVVCKFFYNESHDLVPSRFLIRMEPPREPIVTPNDAVILRELEGRTLMRAITDRYFAKHFQCLNVLTEVHNERPGVQYMSRFLLQNVREQLNKDFVHQRIEALNAFTDRFSWDVRARLDPAATNRPATLRIRCVEPIPLPVHAAA